MTYSIFRHRDFIQIRSQIWCRPVPSRLELLRQATNQLKFVSLAICWYFGANKVVVDRFLSSGSIFQFQTGEICTIKSQLFELSLACRVSNHSRVLSSVNLGFSTVVHPSLIHSFDRYAPVPDGPQWWQNLSAGSDLQHRGVSLTVAAAVAARAIEKDCDCQADCLPTYLPTDYFLGSRAAANRLAAQLLEAGRVRCKLVDCEE